MKVYLFLEGPMQEGGNAMIVGFPELPVVGQSVLICNKTVWEIVEVIHQIDKEPEESKHTGYMCIAKPKPESEALNSIVT